MKFNLQQQKKLVLYFICFIFYLPLLDKSGSYTHCWQLSANMYQLSDRTVKSQSSIWQLHIIFTKSDATLKIMVKPFFTWLVLWDKT